MAGTQAKILVIDDNPENRALVQATLGDEGYEVLLAPSGTEGISMFEKEHPDCVLLDVRMPGMDGFAVCTHLRTLPEGAHTPIIFLTALRDVDTFDRALQAGGDDFLTKPIRPTELVVRVETVLKLKQVSAELREHYELVRHQRDDLMRLQLQKERLTAFVVHDLKNPLNSMDLHAQLLLRAQELSTPSRESAQSIRDGARSLLRLILNLLDISKSEEGRLTPKYQEIALSKLIGEVVETHQVKAKNAGVDLKHVVEVEQLRADRDLLVRVIENLLDNAIRHAPSNSEVTISGLRRGEAIEIRVADAGLGIPHEMRQRIFEPFVQLEAHGASRSGRGLGLTFCKLAAEAHGGSIWAEEGSPGTVFCVRLPE